MNMFRSTESKLQKAEFNLKMAMNMLNKEAKKRLEASKKSKKKVKEFMKKGEMETARIHAENAVRQFNEHKNYTLMAARLDAVTQKVKTARAVGNLSNNMKKVVAGIGSVIDSMNVEKLSKVMEKFEEDNLTLEVRTEYMDQKISNTTQVQTPEKGVDAIMQEVGDGLGLDISAELEDFTPNAVPQKHITTEDPNAKEEV